MGNQPLHFTDPVGLNASFCSAEFSYEDCGGDALFWAGPGGGMGGWAFGGDYARAQQQGYVSGMPTAMWQALRAHTKRLTELLTLQRSDETSIVTSTVTFDSGGQYRSTTITEYRDDGQRVVNLDDIEILQASVPSLRSVTPAVYSLYQGIASKTGQRYYGITNDLGRRAIEHARNGIMVHRTAILAGVDYMTAKGAEQFMINAAGLATLSNRINSIAAANPLYRQAIAQGCQALKAAGVSCP